MQMSLSIVDDYEAPLGQQKRSLRGILNYLRSPDVKSSNQNQKHLPKMLFLAEIAVVSYPHHDIEIMKLISDILQELCEKHELSEYLISIVNIFTKCPDIGVSLDIIGSFWLDGSLDSGVDRRTLLDCVEFASRYIQSLSNSWKIKYHRRKEIYLKCQEPDWLIASSDNHRLYLKIKQLLNLTSYDIKPTGLSISPTQKVMIVRPPADNDLRTLQEIINAIVQIYLRPHLNNLISDWDDFSLTLHRRFGSIAVALLYGSPDVRYGSPDVRYGSPKKPSAFAKNVLTTELKAVKQFITEVDTHEINYRDTNINTALILSLIDRILINLSQRWNQLLYLDEKPDIYEDLWRTLIAHIVQHILIKLASPDFIYFILDRFLTNPPDIKFTTGACDEGLNRCLGDIALEIAACILEKAESTVLTNGILVCLRFYRQTIGQFLSEIINPPHPMVPWTIVDQILFVKTPERIATLPYLPGDPTKIKTRIRETLLHKIKSIKLLSRFSGSLDGYVSSIIEYLWKMAKDPIKLQMLSIYLLRGLLEGIETSVYSVYV